MIKLADILKGLSIEEVRGNTNISLSDITFDSRKASPGVLFVAVKGTKTDGHDYISHCTCCRICSCCMRANA